MCENSKLVQVPMNLFPYLCTGTNDDGTYTEAALEWYSQNGLKVETLAFISHEVKFPRYVLDAI